MPAISAQMPSLLIQWFEVDGFHCEIIFFKAPGFSKETVANVLLPSSLDYPGFILLGAQHTEHTQIQN